MTRRLRESWSGPMLRSPMGKSTRYAVRRLSAGISFGSRRKHRVIAKAG